MGNSISIFFLIEAVGTIAFASSGAMVAIRQNLDLLGIIVLGVTTAVGGGMMRDILLGIVPPSLFTNPIYTIMAFITVMVLFIVIRMNQHFLEGDCIVTYEKLMNIFDAIGLAAFTVTGIDTAVMAGYGDYHFLSVFLGAYRCRRRTFKGYYGKADPLYPEKTCLCMCFHCRWDLLFLPAFQPCE